MEKRKLKLSLSKLLESSLFVKILAVVLAVILWFTLSIAVYPNVEKRIANIPLTVSVGVGNSSENTLTAQNLDSFSVTANISGARYEIGNFTADNLTATVDTSSVTKAGEYTLDVSVSASNGESIEVLSVSPKQVTLSFDYTITKLIELTADRVDTSSLTTADGYVKDIPEISPTTVSIEGPKTLVDTIDQATIRVLDEVSDLTESFSTTNTDIVLYNENGDEIPQDKLSVSPESFAVQVSVTKQDTAPVSISFMNSQGNDASDIFDADSIVSLISPQAISVNATSDSDQSDITLELSQNLREVKPGDTVAIDSASIKAALSAKGLTAADGSVSSIYVTYKSDGITAKTISIPQSSIVLDNAPDGKDITITTEEISDVTVYGPEDILNSLSDEDFIAYLDLSKAELSNDTFPVTIYCPGQTSVWAYGDQKITLMISDTSDETTTES